MDMLQVAAIVAIVLATQLTAAAAEPLSWEGVEVSATDDNGTATGDPRMAIDGVTPAPNYFMR